MPFAIGDYEKQLLKMGHIVAVISARKFRCWQCEQGELKLTRKIDEKGQLSPAFFRCDTCDDEISIYPDKGGGVQPALKMSMRGKGFSADQPGETSGAGYTRKPSDDGGWR